MTRRRRCMIVVFGESFGATAGARDCDKPPRSQRALEPGEKLGFQSVSASLAPIF